MHKDKQKIIIAIPTHKRPEGLSAALQSLKNIEMPRGATIEVLIVENDRCKTMDHIIDEFSKFPVHYALEPNPGLVNVRNRILDEACRLEADYLAGFDDDETVTTQWLSALWRGLGQYNATVATGPTLAAFETDAPTWIKTGNFFKTETTRRTGQILERSGTNNYLVDLHFLAKHSFRFDVSFNHLGSEDTDFFSRISTNGGKIVWVNEAIIHETIPAARLTLNYLLKRDFRIGLGRAARARKKSAAEGFISGISGLITAVFYITILPFHWTQASFSKRLCKIIKQTGVFVGLFKIEFKIYG